MTRTCRRSLWVTAIALTVAAAAPASVGAQSPTPIAVVVHPASSVGNLKLSELKAIFLGKKKYWDDGTRIVPINLAAAHPARTAFDAKALGMSPTDVGRYWVKQKIQGRAIPPKSVPQPSVAAKMVSKIRGAIGYLPSTGVPANVKTITIDGRAPEAGGYPIQLGN